MLAAPVSGATAENHTTLAITTRKRVKFDPRVQYEPDCVLSESATTCYTRKARLVQPRIVSRLVSAFSNKLALSVDVSRHVLFHSVFHSELDQMDMDQETRTTPPFVYVHHVDSSTGTYLHCIKIRLHLFWQICYNIVDKLSIYTDDKLRILEHVPLSFAGIIRAVCVASLPEPINCNTNRASSLTSSSSISVSSYNSIASPCHPLLSPRSLSREETHMLQTVAGFCVYFANIFSELPHVITPPRLREGILDCLFHHTVHPDGALVVYRCSLSRRLLGSTGADKEEEEEMQNIRAVCRDSPIAAKYAQLLHAMRTRANVARPCFRFQGAFREGIVQISAVNDEKTLFQSKFSAQEVFSSSIPKLDTSDLWKRLNLFIRKLAPCRASFRFIDVQDGIAALLNTLQCEAASVIACEWTKRMRKSKDTNVVSSSSSSSSSPASSGWRCMVFDDSFVSIAMIRESIHRLLISKQRTKEEKEDGRHLDDACYVVCKYMNEQHAFVNLVFVSDALRDILLQKSISFRGEEGRDTEKWKGGTVDWMWRDPLMATSSDASKEERAVIVEEVLEKSRTVSESPFVSMDGFLEYLQNFYPSIAYTRLTKEDDKNWQSCHCDLLHPCDCVVDTKIDIPKYEVLATQRQGSTSTLLPSPSSLRGRSNVAATATAAAAAAVQQKTDIGTYRFLRHQQKTYNSGNLAGVDRRNPTTILTKPLK